LESLRDANRRRVLEELRRRGTASRAELARATGLSRSTVSTLVGDLQGAGLVVEREGEGRRQQGRPPVLLTIDPGAGVVIGIDFGHSDVRVAVGDLSRRVLADRVAPCDTDNAGLEAIDIAADLVDEALADAGVPRERVLAAGVALSSPVDHEDDTVHRSTILPSWTDIRPAAEIGSRLGVPVFVDNDANLGALAEMQLGAAAGRRDVVYLMIGSGIGAGIVVDGRVVVGAGGTAGEIGHMLVDENGPICRCGNRGCLETYAAGPAIVDLLNRTHGPDLTLDGVIGLVRGGDQGAVRALQDAGHVVGKALAAVCNVLNPELIVIGGELSAAGDVLLEPIRAAIRRHAIRPAAEDVEVVQASLNERPEVLGALIHAAQRADLPHVPKPA
jgi:predicted NBD/HSP70 family sugar kinase/biotin operon repressor